jgi:hypothetical protein
MGTYPKQLSLRTGYPDFREMPWDLPLAEWQGCCPQLVEVPRGAGRHPIWFVVYNGALYALKELPPGKALQEYQVLCYLEEAHLPAVTPVGYALTETRQGPASVLISRYLEGSVPFSMLFTRSGLERYREHLLDAIASLLVQLHLSGVYWGDCSLSNTLFRRDAGSLQAYLVDAETAQIIKGYFPPVERHHELEIMQENITGELLDLRAADLLSMPVSAIPWEDTGAYIRLRYQRLWEEITREDLINSGEHYRITERIRALNDLGFSVGDVQLAATPGGDQLRLRVLVTDRNFHRDQLYNLTGLDVEEMQARKLMNEIQELKATLARLNNRSTPLSVAAYHWLEHVFTPVVERLSSMTDAHTTPVELYCQVLEHKWYLSERARHDVGHEAATQDYLAHFGVPQQE